MQASQHIVINTSLDLNLPWTLWKLSALFLFRLAIFPQHYSCKVYQIKSHLNVVTNRQHYVRGWKIWWKNQVHRYFVVTPSLQEAWVATITWYKYPLLGWNLSDCSFPQMKKGWPQTKITCCDHIPITITYDY